MDAATGLIYVGNGQYYDPATGRFLTRDARPNQNNPYTPIDPTGALLGPLALFALAYGRKKSRGKGDMLVILLVLSLSLGVGLAACGGGGTPSPTPTPLPTPVVIRINAEPTATTVSANGAPIATLPPLIAPGVTCTIILSHPEPTEDQINSTIQALADYIFGDGKRIKPLSENAVRGNIDGYLRRLMDEAARQGLNTNHLAYIYATTHVESAWGDWEERYDGEVGEDAKKAYFENKYGRYSDKATQLGNTEYLDGYSFLGRGFVHITGRANYKKVSIALGLGDLLITEPYKAACGLGCDGNDYVTQIAVTGMKEGTFTTIGLLDASLNGLNGSFDFENARAIIGWGGDGSNVIAANLANGYARILSEHCALGGVTKELTCVNCE